MVPAKVSRNGVRVYAGRQEFYVLDHAKGDVRKTRHTTVIGMAVQFYWRCLLVWLNEFGL